MSEKDNPNFSRKESANKANVEKDPEEIMTPQLKIKMEILCFISAFKFE